MKTFKRIFLIVADSLGAGYAPDAEKYGDVGANTLRSVVSAKHFKAPVLAEMGLFRTGDFEYKGDSSFHNGHFAASFSRLSEKSAGKDTVSGHWEIAGLISKNKMPTYPDGFPKEAIDEFSRLTGRTILCNKPYSGTQVIHDYGPEHEKTGALIVYTSADSVFQIAAHENIVPIEQLYEYCHMARELMMGDFLVERIIARPFIGTFPDYIRTSNRHDYTLQPHDTTLLDLLKESGLDVISVGKIFDIFAGRSITESHPSKSNSDGMRITSEMADRDFNGLCFVNLVDFDSVFGHRNDIEGYANALMELDTWLGTFLPKLNEDDLLILTADHGCDPGFKGTDHTREYVPALFYSPSLESVDLGTRDTFADIGATVANLLNVETNQKIAGATLPLILKINNSKQNTKLSF